MTSTAKSPPDTSREASSIEIAALVHRYAFFVRRNQGLNCGELFAEDAIYEIREVDASSANNPARLRGRIEGRQRISEYIHGSGARGIRVCPLIHNLLIDIDGHQATANSMLESRTWPAGHEFTGEYEDCFRYEDGKWLFQSRIFTIFLDKAPPDNG